MVFVQAEENRCSLPVVRFDKLHDGGKDRPVDLPLLVDGRPAGGKVTHCRNQARLNHFLDVSHCVGIKNVDGGPAVNVWLIQVLEDNLACGEADILAGSRHELSPEPGVELTCLRRRILSALFVLGKCP